MLKGGVVKSLAANTSGGSNFAIVPLQMYVFPANIAFMTGRRRGGMRRRSSVLNGYYQGAGGQVPGSRDPISEIVCSYGVVASPYYVHLNEYI